jgi:hypothetical protein
MILTRGRIPLKGNVGEGSPDWPDEEIAEALDVTIQTFEGLRKQIAGRGWALNCWPAYDNNRVWYGSYKKKVYRDKE